MKMPRYGLIAAAVMLCSVALSFARDVTATARYGLAALAQFVLRSVDPRPIIYRDPSSRDEHSFAHLYGDPHVVRHEAGMSQLAAARGV